MPQSMPQEKVSNALYCYRKLKTSWQGHISDEDFKKIKVLLREIIPPGHYVSVVAPKMAVRMRAIKQRQHLHTFSAFEVEFSTFDGEHTSKMPLEAFLQSYNLFALDCA